MNYKDISQLIRQKERSSVTKTNITLDGTGNQYLDIPSTYTNYLSYQISDSGDLSTNVTVTLEMSQDGEDWITATDSAGDPITQTLNTSGSIIEKLSSVTPGLLFRINFVTVATGTLNITIRY